MASGIRDFSFTFASRIFVLGLGVGTQSCLARVLGPGDRGAFATCIVFVTMLTIFCVLGCDVAALYFVSSKKQTISEGIVQTLVYGGLGCLLAVTVGLLMIHLKLPFISKASPQAFYLSLLFIPTSFFLMTFLQLVTALQEFKYYSFISVLSGFLNLILALALVWWWSLGVEGALISNILSNVLVIGACLHFFRRYHGLHWVRPQLSSLLEMLHYGIRYYVAKISQQVNFQIGTIILALFATKEDVGLFSVAALLTSQVLIIPDTLMTILIPRSASEEQGRKDMIAKCARISGVICGAMLLTLAILAEPVVRIIFSESFLPIVPLIRILVIGNMVWCACKVFTAYLVGTNHPGSISISVISGVVLNMLLLWLLLPVIGLSGAAIAMTMGYIVNSAIIVIAFCRLSKTEFFSLLRMRRSDWDSLAPVFGKIFKRE